MQDRKTYILVRKMYLTFFIQEIVYLKSCSEIELNTRLNITYK